MGSLTQFDKYKTFDTHIDKNNQFLTIPNINHNINLNFNQVEFFWPGRKNINQVEFFNKKFNHKKWPLNYG